MNSTLKIVSLLLALNTCSESSAVIHGVFEAGSSFRVEWHTAGGVQVLFFMGFLLLLAKCSHWEREWGLADNSMEF